MPSGVKRFESCFERHLTTIAGTITLAHGVTSHNPVLTSALEVLDCHIGMWQEGVFQILVPFNLSAHTFGGVS
jgi:hypothetical protein